ncbi:response regulator transcription factor [Mucilaginibacter gilvus]|uniref:Response regulator transcription factor n=1 Tax=Mucilaginibacter gilvus TaxID=2305909 RepID=A0A444MNP6_9SPHI|nr:response regulator transcription factor [Mucilaginibacter gilvus]RWY52262.1 response regulator transcription factor [Mucilaginibacter gilvus]
MPTEAIQIVLVDDHRLFRSGLVSLINSLGGYMILFEAANGEELTRKLSPQLKPDIILLDINMPVMGGIETARWLKSNYPDICVIVLSMFEDAEKVLTMVKLGVKGYLLKDAEPYEFESALRKVAQGEIYYPEFVTRHLVNSFNRNADEIKLNSRELEFLKLAGTELTYKEIADHMCISARTVDGYRDQLFEKLQIKSRVGLVLYAIKNNLVQL